MCQGKWEQNRLLCSSLDSYYSTTVPWWEATHEMVLVHEFPFRSIFGSSCIHQVKQTWDLGPLRTDSPLPSVSDNLYFMLPWMPWYSEMWWFRNELEEMKIPINTVMSLYSSGHTKITSLAPQPPNPCPAQPSPPRSANSAPGHSCPP